MRYLEREKVNNYMSEILKLAEQILERNKDKFYGTEISRKYHILEDAINQAKYNEESLDIYKQGFRSLRTIEHRKKAIRNLAQKIEQSEVPIKSDDLRELECLNNEIKMHLKYVVEAEFRG
jgi:hypothetical protein